MVYSLTLATTTGNVISPNAAQIITKDVKVAENIKWIKFDAIKKDSAFVEI